MAIWNEETEDQLISMIQERPALYDITEKCYANRVVKKELWREIVNKLVISEKELRKRWDSLRTQYSRYKKLGTPGAQKTGRQQWILTRLQFLEPHTKRKESTSNLAIRDPSAAAMDSDSPAEGCSSETSTSTPVESCFFGAEPRPITPLAESTICGAESMLTPLREEPLPSITSHSSTQRSRVKRSRKTQDESDDEESTNLMRTIGKALEKLASQEDHDDAISAYCKNIEHRMRMLPPHLLPHFQHEVDNCLFKYSTSSFLLSQPKDQGRTDKVPFATAYQTYSRLEGAINRLWQARVV